MGGCRCSYRNCSLRTDGKTHMFHYPVFDKVRCHQWLTNARKLEFLNLKVSQLKNRVVCQHHFKDENFMNFKKDKLTFDAVPTEDGPYCDSSHLEKLKGEQDDTKVFSISLDDIENEYLTIVDKKANFSVKYGDFLTNCDLMELDALNSLTEINDNKQINLEGLRVLDSNPSVPKEVRKVRRTRRKDIGSSSKSILNKNNKNKNAKVQDNSVIVNTNSTNPSKESETRQTEGDKSSAAVNVSVVPVEYEKIQLSEKNQQNVGQSIELNVFDEPKHVDQNEVNIFQSIEEPAFGKTHEQNQVNAYQPVEAQVFDQTNVHSQLNSQPPAQVHHEIIFNDQDLNMHQPIEAEVVNKTKPPNKTNNSDTRLENKKIRIISEKKIIPGIGKLQPISPTTVLPIPNKKSFNAKPIKQIPAVPDTSNNNMAVEAPRSYSILKSNREGDKSPNVSTHSTSIVKNMIPPERVAAIAEKRKFNMKLRDIIEDCLDKLDDNDKSGYDVRKEAHNKRIIDSKKGQVCNFLARDPQLPTFQEYTIAYLEARMKKMENNLLNKIEENSQKIGELKQAYGPSVSKKSVHTQTSVHEDVHKKQLYHELSKYLSKEANSLIYEELFINKYIQDVPKSSAKRRKYR
uniref:THAP-type domain-containing protein n=1 Tax=Heliothis virescens TaxID=7102 RepID=A0A2A4JPN5_HELVI